MSLVKKLVQVILASITVAIALLVTAQYVQAEYSQYQLENVCISEWIEIGMERKHIVRDNGDCYYKRTFGG